MYAAFAACYRALRPVLSSHMSELGAVCMLTGTFAASTGRKGSSLRMAGPPSGPLLSERRGGGTWVPVSTESSAQRTACPRHASFSPRQQADVRTVSRTRHGHVEHPRADIPRRTTHSVDCIQLETDERGLRGAGCASASTSSCGISNRPLYVRSSRLGCLVGCRTRGAQLANLMRQDQRALCIILFFMTRKYEWPSAARSAGPVGDGMVARRKQQHIGDVDYALNVISLGPTYLRASVDPDDSASGPRTTIRR
ncbi:uncharacterized protein B0H18DRAFT_666521 [Fomitopsis serialis]|uniref:uncharacterized protein n=1 Tax=Fomitopsis serialis TaxID=139415 RepID=UPI0020073D2A|nr:uncharacterized protein B0H18DRAFT_666521 [Neoantrodia serialis]KAH9918485.1 hypothetical protein B0H18DRAFT_666521 [Neoantrodia serialis]